jgi:hypothetical protein
MKNTHLRRCYRKAGASGRIPGREELHRHDHVVRGPREHAVSISMFKEASLTESGITRTTACPRFSYRQGPAQLPCIFSPAIQQKGIFFLVLMLTYMSGMG